MVPSTRMSLLATLLLLLCPCLVSSSSSSTPSSLSSADELLLARALLSPLGGNATAASSGGTQRALLGATDQYAWEYTSPFECGVPTDYRAVGKQKIDQLWVWGERNTGTGYTQRLFDFNLDIPNEVIGGLTWKHGFMHAQQLAASSHTVFLFMVRDLFGWLESMNRAPHHADRRLFNQPLDAFVKAPWGSGKLDTDPQTKTKQFANILKLRTAKLKDWLVVKDCLPYVVEFRYEELFRYPKQTVRYVAEKFDIPIERGGTITTDICVVNGGVCVAKDKGAVTAKMQAWMNRKWMNRFSPSLIRWILANHDWDVEAQFGFDYSYLRYYLNEKQEMS